ncbi:MAG: Type II secretion system F domain protein [Parcubacteria group bacterium GW2011_GWA2_38_13]|nr:MAG: Type II secretion system F domain protein [Parcubacteria group bacterium GW2011_GWA2_38_13]
MPSFYYKAINTEKQSTVGFVEAPTLDMAADVLIEKGYIILGLTEKKTRGKSNKVGLFQGIPLKHTVVFSRQLSILISSSIPLVQSLKILLRQTFHPRFKIMVAEIVSDVEGGMKFSSALAKHPAAFDNFFVNIVKSGETSGKLDEVLLYMADQMEKDYDLISRIRSAMIYPLFIVCGLFVVGMLMMIFVIPKITALLLEANATLPLTTRMLIGTSNFLRNFWWLTILLLIGGFLLIRYIVKTPNGKYAWDSAKLRMPVFGSLFQKIAIVRFARSLFTLISGGVTLPKGFKIVSEVVGNSVYRELILETVKEVESGNPIASVFEKSPSVPIMVSQMLNVGEKTGRLDMILDKIASFYSREIDNLLRNLVTLIEPIVMVVIGVAVGLMIAAIILPMYNLASAI